jgi:RHS repeat-associated protein
MKKIKVVMVVAVLVLSHVYFESHNNQKVVENAVAASMNVPPVVEVLPDVSSGKAPLTVHFEGDAFDEDGDIRVVEWDFTGDGVFEIQKSIAKDLEKDERRALIKNEMKKEFTFTKAGVYHVLVRATDDKEESSVSSVTVQVYSEVPYLDVVPCNKNEFTYMAKAGYEAFFKDTITEKEAVRFQVKDAWISYQFKEQTFSKISNVQGVPEENTIWYYDVFPGIDVRYTIYEDLLLEEFIVTEYMPLSVVEQSFTVHGVDFSMNEDGSIGFYQGETLVFSIPKPVMYELNNPQNKCYGLHYEVVQEKDAYIIKKVIDNTEWLKKAGYPVVIDSSTQGEIADPWEQQGLTPYGQYFENLNEYVDPLTGHLTIRHTDYSLPGRGLDLTVTRVYSTVVAYKQGENSPGEYIPVATYQEAPTDLGCGWSLDFPWIEVTDDNPGEYMHLSNGAQVKTNFQNGVWEDPVHQFTMYKNADDTYTRYRKNGIKEEYDEEGKITSMTDLNGNTIMFSYGQYGISSITDTVGRVLTFTYSGEKLTGITDGVKTITYGYSGDKLVSVTDPIGRVTSYNYLAGNSFLITGVHYPSGGFSTYEYAAVVPATGKLAPYKSAHTDEGIYYFVYKVDTDDTVSWTSPKDINSVTVSAGRPYVLQRDDGSLVMYFKDKYVWTETVWKCYGGECWEETITHTEYWVKRSTSTDQQHWSTPENCIQVKSTTGNPVVIEKQDGSFIMYYKDKYTWTEENCYWEGCPWDCQYICETITHTEYWIYQRTSSDGLIWGSPVKMKQTTLGVRNIAVIQKQDSTYLLCYTDKVGTTYYIRQMTSTNGTSWGSPSNVTQVNSSTGNPALLQQDNGTVYLAYRKGNNIYVQSNSGSGWSTAVQTTAAADGDPALLDTLSNIVVVYKGTDNYVYRISSADGVTWSSPLQVAPNTALSDPATTVRKDRFYRVTAQYISASAADLVKVTEFSYEGESQLPWSSDVIIRDAQTIRSSMHFEYDSKGRTTERISKDENGVQTEKIVYTYNGRNQVVRQDVYTGTSTEISYSVSAAYDNHGNTRYTRGPEGAEHYYSYANTNSESLFVDSKGTSINLFSNQFYTNTVPLNCHTLPVGQAFINNGKVQETYYKYDVNGNLIETKTLFPTRDYAVFSGTFTEPGQTTFEFDLTGLTITDGILVISSIAVPTLETLYETHSEPGIGFQNTGSWQNKYFMADYHRCTPEPDCFDGQINIGPFEHYPGSPGYTGYTTWIEDNTQYVKTSYSKVINEYPEQPDYKLNTSSWTTITDNLGSGTTSITIPAADFVQGINTLQFQETNTFSTKFEWTLYINQGSTPEEYLNTFTYDIYGNVTSATDALGNTSYFGYDSHHIYLTSATDALNHTTTATYDFNTGQVVSMTNAKGNTVFFEYDILGRVKKRINPDFTEKEVIYNDQSNTVTIYDELDHYTIQYYDGIGRLTTCEWYLSPSTYLVETYTYDYQGNILTRTDPGGYTSSCEYDSRGRPVKISNPDATYKQVSYDDMTNTVVLYDENQHKKEYHMNWTQDIQQVKEYTDAVTYYLTQYTYDSVGNLTSVINANGNTTRYNYDSLFGVTQVLYPDSTGETCTYDAVGNVIQKTNGNGTTLFTYNDVYQVTDILYPDSTLISFQYDENGNCILMTDPAGYTATTYDERNRLILETRTINGVPYTTQYTYDAASTMLSIIYPDQSTITYEYDSLYRLTSIPGYCEFTYNTDSLLADMVFNNGVTTSFTYDDCHRPVTIDTLKGDIPLLSMDYHYDPVGNITQLEYSRDQWIQSEETFQYDWLDRLVSAQGDYGVLQYSYDSVGNRLSQNGITSTYNNMNELVSVSDGTVFTYDDNGNTATKTEGDTTWVYTYDARNLLTQITKNQEICAQFTYDGNGKRIQKTEWIDSLQDYQTIIYVYSGPNVIYEKNTDTNQEALYVYGPTGRISKTVSGLTDYYHTDHLGSTRLVTDESGNVITHAEYYPFGESLNEEERYLYTGKEKDSSGLYYYGARYYDPETGRFLTRDPLTGKTHSPQSLNRYTYCLNNPLTYVDPLGLSGRGVLPEDGRGPHMSALGKYSNYWESLLRRLRSIWEEIGESVDSLVEFFQHHVEGILQKIWQHFLYTGQIEINELYALMSLLEAIVNVFGDVLGISGAFICIEGMGDLLWYGGGQGGVCLMYHPDLGWAYYTYTGSLRGLMMAGGVSIVAGFWTWHRERRFRFEDWEGLFEGTATAGGGSVLSFSVVKFNNTDYTITGWGVGVGLGIGYGIAGFSSIYERAENWMIPLDLWGIVVPQGE